MTKIKNFRISLRPRDIARWLKRERQIESSPELEAAIESALAQARPIVHPAAVYTTLGQATAEKITVLPWPAKAVAISALAVSIGDELAIRTAAAQQTGDSQQESLWTAIQEEALIQTVSFVVRLLQEQAKEEECLLSDSSILQVPEAIAPVATLLGTSRIGWDPETPRPAWVRLATLSWTPLRKSSTPARRADSGSGRTRETIGV